MIYRWCREKQRTKWHKVIFYGNQLNVMALCGFPSKWWVFVVEDKPDTDCCRNCEAL